MDAFVYSRQQELQTKLAEYQKISDEQIEYERLLRFCEDFLGWKDGRLDAKEKDKKLKTMTALSSTVFTNTEVYREGPIVVRLIDDLFVEMTVPRAVEFTQKKVKLLQVLRNRTRSECHYLQAQINILLLGMEKMMLENH